jgi:transcriptional regulator with XRE-family HTH domain
MWLDKIKEIKKEKGMTTKQLAELSNVPEKTVCRILSGVTTSPLMVTMIQLAGALGTSLDEIFAESRAVVSDSTVTELKEDVEVMSAEKDLTDTKNKMLEDKVNALTLEVELLKKELLHKEELLALHNFYNKLTNNCK